LRYPRAKTIDMTTNTFPRMHVSLYVKNIAETVNFYTSFFGIPAVKIKPGYAKYILDKPSLIISFVENPERVQPHFGHLGFQVETLEELNRKMEDARSKNMIALEEIGTNCCYARQDKYWVNDPDGVQWEVYYFHEDAEFNDPHYEMNDANACCMPAKEEKTSIKLSELKTVNSCDPKSGCC
jgi:catechol 2,3-dioxygenase-like lactoylglutathione lyase family enzyme